MVPIWATYPMLLRTSTGPAEVGARDGGGAARGVEQSGDHAQSRGLSRAVRPEKADDLARVDGDVDALDGLDGLGRVLAAGANL